MIKNKIASKYSALLKIKSKKVKHQTNFKKIGQIRRGNWFHFNELIEKQRPSHSHDRGTKDKSKLLALVHREIPLETFSPLR